MTPAQAKQMTAYMRKMGARSFEVNGLKVEFGEQPRRGKSAAEKALEELQEDPTYHEEMAKKAALDAAKAYEELMYHSA